MAGDRRSIHSNVDSLRERNFTWRSETSMAPSIANARVINTTKSASDHCVRIAEAVVAAKLAIADDSCCKLLGRE
eukprot:1468026-Amphidinium_carterae.1